MESKDPISTAHVRFPNDTKIEGIMGTRYSLAHEFS